MFLVCGLGNESAKFWLCLKRIKNRGVNDILIACIDGLSGFTNAIEAVFRKQKYSNA
ncbi:MAG: transposase [Clostridia bacterium]